MLGRADCSLEILSPKKVRNVEASDDGDDDDKVGSVGRCDHDSRVFSVFQSLRGCVACFAMSVR